MIEGLVTAGIVLALLEAAPETLVRSERGSQGARAWGSLAACALLLGEVVSWFASGKPDGLEWSIERVSGKEELADPAGGVHGWFSSFHEKLTILPDYSFPNLESKAALVPVPGATEGRWPNRDPGTSLAGILGGLVVSFVILAWALVLRLARKANSPKVS